jgi:folate-binding protein YgfZ
MSDAPLDLRSESTVAVVRRDVVDVSGPDAIGYLQGQLSQDVEALAIGQSAWSLLLQPTGKVDAWLRVTRTADDAARLDVDEGAGETVLARLRRFKLRTKAELELSTWAPDQPVSDPEELEARRIEAGVPAMGAEITEATIPAELGQWLIDASVSFTKGCYTGQELVARIDSRGGKGPRPLRGLVVQGDVPAVGAEVRVGGAPVGTVTSSARSPELGPIALALLARSVEPGTTVEVDGVDGALTAEVRELPLR